jgi:hypothetical protein
MTKQYQPNNINNINKLNNINNVNNINNTNNINNINKQKHPPIMKKNRTSAHYLNEYDFDKDMDYYKNKKKVRRSSTVIGHYGTNPSL